MKPIQSLICWCVLLVCSHPGGALASPQEEDTLVIGAGLFYGLIFIPSGSARTSDYSSPSERNIELRITWRRPLLADFELEGGLAKGRSLSDGFYAPGFGDGFEHDYELLHASTVIAWPGDQYSHQLLGRAGINLHNLDYRFTPNEQPAGWEPTRKQFDRVGWQAGIGWRWRMDWGELGIDYTMTAMHPVYIRHVHSNIGWRF